MIPDLEGGELTGLFLATFRPDSDGARIFKEKSKRFPRDELTWLFQPLLWHAITPAWIDIARTELRLIITEPSDTQNTYLTKEALLSNLAAQLSLIRLIQRHATPVTYCDIPKGCRGYVHGYRKKIPKRCYPGDPHGLQRISFRDCGGRRRAQEG